MEATSSISVNLPQYNSVKILILQFSSSLKLKNGNKFRVCNVCSRRLSFELTNQHTEHLKLHPKHWKSYLSKLTKLLKIEIDDDKKTVKQDDIDEGENDEEVDSESSDSEEEMNVYNVVDSLQHSWQRPPPLTTFEHLIMRKYSYDVNPIRAYREYSDIQVINMCNNLKCQQIDELIGEGISLDLLAPSRLFDPKSETVNKIARLLCEKQCYYLPGECFFDDQHTSDFKELLKKELHDKFNPVFKNLIMKDASEAVHLAYNQYHQPKVYELCEAVGFTTKLEYNSDGYLDLNYDLFCEELWDFETPLYTLELKKVLDVILGLLISASETFSGLRQRISGMYSQSLFGLNKPMLSIMKHGTEIQPHSSSSEKCDITRDEIFSRWKLSVSHPKCKNFTGENYWMYQHHQNDPSALSAAKDTDDTRKGPASLQDQSIVYPCNLGHWHECECENCTLVRNVNCIHHKKHMEFNLKKCLVKEAVQCEDHHIDHPENVQPGDIVINRNVLFHNGELFKNGRNYRVNQVILADMKLKCQICRRNTVDHFSNHHAVHADCELCLYETKTMEDIHFWNKVCHICGKKFETERLKEIHRKKHDVAKEQCEYCGKCFSSKFNFQRHLIEQHNVFQHSNNGPFDGKEEDEEYKFECNICKRNFKYERNVIAHIDTIHYRRDECECKLCGMQITRKSNLKRHLAEQHGMIDVERELYRESLKVFTCNVCKKQFKRKFHLYEHEKIHRDIRERYSCNECEETFISIYTLRRHKKTHLEEEEVHECFICNMKFNREWNLKEHSKTHTDNRNKFQCDQCPKSFLSHRALNRHLKEKH